MRTKIFGILATFILPIALFIFSPYWSAYFSDKKQLSYEVLLKRELTNLGSSESNWPGIKISYEGQDVSTGSFVTLAITNTGKLPIKREDFDSPITILISEPDLIMSSKTTFSSPNNLDVALTKVKDGISVAPLLLNPDDQFFIEIFSKSALDITGIRSRIVGLASITPAQPEAQSGFYIGISSVKPKEAGSKNPISNIPFWLVLLLSNVLLIASLLHTWTGTGQNNIGASIIVFGFGVLMYAMSLAGYALSVSYLIEVLDLKKWPGLTALIIDIFFCGYTANFLRHKFL